MKTEFVPFRSELIPEAGRLLAQRHACDRGPLPLLPSRFRPRFGFEDVSYIRAKKVNRMIAWARDA